MRVIQALRISFGFHSFTRLLFPLGPIKFDYFILQKIKISGTFLLLLLACQSLYSQSTSYSPYNLDWKKDASALTFGAGLSLTTFIWEHRMEDRSPLEVSMAEFDNVLGLDEKVLDNRSSSAAIASDWVVRGAAVMPLTLLFDSEIRQDAKKIGVLGSEAFLLSYGLTNLAKVSVKRNRPFVFNPEVPIEEKLSPDSRLSFFSGHTSAASTATFFTAKIWTDYHPDSRWKPVVWTAAATIPAVTGYLRVKAGKHYVSDVMAGYAVGALVGYFVPHFHKMKRGEKRKLRMSTSMIDEVPVFNLKYRF